MDPLLNRLQDLEARYERLLLTVQQLSRQIANLANQLQQTQGQSGGGGTGGGGIVYFIAPIVIAAGGSVTGQTILVNIGGILTATAATAAVVWNMMAWATVATAGKNIIVGTNPDGSYSVITQSC